MQLQTEGAEWQSPAAVAELHNQIGLVVAVSVFQPEYAGLIDNEDAAVPKLESCRTCQLVVEDAALSRTSALCVDVVEESKRSLGFGSPGFHCG